LSSHFVASDTDFLSFKPSTDIKDDVEFYGQSYPIIFHGSSPFHKVVNIRKIVNRMPPTIIIQCLVEKLSPENPLRSARLRFINSTTGKLQDNTQDDAIGSSSIFIGHLEFEAKGNPQEGYNFTSKWASNPWEGIFFCELRNFHGSIKSNQLHIRDLDYFQQKLTYNRKNTTSYAFHSDELNLSHLPMTLKCGDTLNQDLQLPFWARKTLKPLISWTACLNSGNSGWGCRKGNEDGIQISRFFESYLKQDGSLILLKRTQFPWEPMVFVCGPSNDKGNQHRFKAHVCLAHLFAIHSAYGDYTFGDLKTEKGSPHYKSFSTVTKQYVLEPGYYEFSLFGEYSLKTPLTWSRADDQPLTNFPKPTDFVLNFSNPIKKEHEGVYKLGNTAAGSFIFDVIILSWPQVSKPPPQTLLVMETKMAEFEVEFKDAHSVLMEYRMLQSYTINGKEASEETGFKHSLLKSGFPKVAYKAWDLQSVKVKDRSHTVTIEAMATGAPGIPGHSVFTTTYVRVLPIPMLEDVLNQDCNIDCLREKGASYSCQFDLRGYQGIKVDVAWYFGNNRLPSSFLKPYVQTEGPKITFKAIGNDSNALASLDLDPVYCQLQIFGLNKEELYKTPKESLTLKLFPDAQLKTSISQSFHPSVGDF
ncbi:hypothetical protein Ciccas_005722, partial [Cichlidogyrus casuarinus]